jgi:glutathione S-transferase
MLKLYDFPLSGNCYKVRLFLSLLGLDYEPIVVDLRAGEHKQAPFLQLNPLGQVPVLIDDDVAIRDSQAILVYLARRYSREDWLPTDAASMSKVMEWLSTAAKEIANYLATARLYYLFGAKVDIDLLEKQAHVLLKVIDAHLAERHWLALDHPTIADLACFPYIALAGDAKISLEAYPHIGTWMKRIKQLPGFIVMPGITALEPSNP